MGLRAEILAAGAVRSFDGRFSGARVGKRRPA